MDNQSYTWTDNPTVSGVSPCNTDVLNDCLMHLKYNSQNGDGFRLFDIKITDRKLIGEEAIGWVIQGGLVTMTYPDAVNQIIEEFDEGVSVTYREISCVQSLTGHYIADISQKDAVDQLFYQTGIADFYILDKTNQQFYLHEFLLYQLILVLILYLCFSSFLDILMLIFLPLEYFLPNYLVDIVYKFPLIPLVLFVYSFFVLQHLILLFLIKLVLQP